MYNPKMYEMHLDYDVKSDKLYKKNVFLRENNY